MIGSSSAAGVEVALANQMLLSILAALGPLLVGGVMVFAGVAKTLDPKNFTGHLIDLHLIPWRWLFPATLALAALQWGWGAALLVALWPRWLLPISVLLLIVLAGVGYWGTATDRAKDCGCYNGVFNVSPIRSLLLDIGYIGLLVFSWRYGSAEASSSGWKLVVVLVAAALGSLLTYASFLYEKKHKRPLYDLSPLRVGRRWSSQWLDGKSLLTVLEGEKIVVFLGADCPHCKRWAKVLNAVHGLAELPSVIGAVVLSEESLDSYLSRSNIRFPVVTVKPWVVARLARGFTPTAVVVEDGVIREKWVGRMPKPFTDQIRSAMAGASRTSVAADPILSQNEAS